MGKSSLSPNAEYPAPVIQLQHMMSTTLVPQDNDLPDNVSLEKTHSSSVNPEIETLRHRLEQIKKINRLE